MKFQTLKIISCTIMRWTVKQRILRIYSKSFYQTIRKTKLIIITTHMDMTSNSTKKQLIMLMLQYIKFCLEALKIKIHSILVTEIKLSGGTFIRVVIQQMKTATQLKITSKVKVKTRRKSKIYLPLMTYLLSLKKSMTTLIMNITKNTSQKE